MDRRVFSVSQINKYIRSVLDEDLILNNLFIEGEISNYKAHPSGHIYCVLKDELSQINCVMFRSSAASLQFTPENGMKVIVLGRVSAYEKTGQYQLYAEIMEPAGVGAKYLAFEQLKQKLYAEGLFDAARKKTLPAYPRRIAVITSGSGAAVQDIINITKRRNKTVKIIVLPTAVQGEKAAGEIVDSLTAVNTWGQADCVILGRGGGAAEDLQAFNEEAVAQAIAASDIPVVSAVGHETDFTIADFTADLRAPTPSAAAEIITPLLSETTAKINGYADKLTSLITNIINQYRQVITRFTSGRALADTLTAAQDRHAYISSIYKRINREITHLLDNARMDLDNRTEMLRSLSPENILKRGYANVYINNMLVTSKNMLSAGQRVRIVFRDGDVGAVVDNTD